MTIPAFHPGELNVYSAPGDVADVSRALRLTGRRVMLVPTMGALHEGHLALVRAAKRVPGSVVVVSIFVNPMQFGAGEDLDAYPRTPDDDLAQLRAEGVEIAFTPTTAAMYPDGLRTTVQPGPLAAELEGGPRPTHFAGVLTVVLKLLQIVRPDRVFFGEKDYQQLVLIRQLVADFNLDVADEHVGHDLRAVQLCARPEVVEVERDVVVGVQAGGHDDVQLGGRGHPGDARDVSAQPDHREVDDGVHAAGLEFA